MALLEVQHISHIDCGPSEALRLELSTITENRRVTLSLALQYDLTIINLFACLYTPTIIL